jgi:para-nitrobenzyl esterase
VLPDLSTEAVFSDADNHSPVPVILGTTRDEPALFMMLDPRHTSSFLWIFRRLKDEAAYLREVKYVAQAWKARGVDELAEYMTAAGNERVYAYRFDWDQMGSLLGFDLSVALGAGHGMEIPFVFGDFERGLNVSYLFADVPEREALVHAMMSYWTAFAENGDPDGGRDGTLPRWLSWGTNGQRSLLLDNPMEPGIRMMDELVTTEAVKQALAEDPDIASREERCALYVRAFRWNADWNRAEYESFGPEGCAGLDPESFSSF